jgi:hypothetical protein
MVAELNWVLVPDVTAKPARGFDPRFAPAPEPVIGLHV